MYTKETSMSMMRTLGRNGYKVGDSRIPTNSFTFNQLLDIFKPEPEDMVMGWDILLMSSYIEGWDVAEDNRGYETWPLDRAG